ncbi:MAG: STN domain-containing protein [Butyricimonas faecalis]
MMKFVFIFMMCCLFQIQAAVYSQQAKVSVEFRNVSLEKVFQELERQSNCSFLYNHRVVEARGKVSIQVVDKELSQVLDELLTKLGLGFTFDDNLVIIERTSMWGKILFKRTAGSWGESLTRKNRPCPA